MPRFLDRLLGRPENLRASHFAGHFYPEDATQVRGVLGKYIPQDISTSEPPPRAIVVPHGQLDLCASVGAKAWGLVKAHQEHYNRVVLLSSAQRVPFQGLALSAHDAWHSPLGNVWISEFDLERVAHLEHLRLMDVVHDTEPALEVQLPLLVETLGSQTKMMPVLAGDGAAEVLREFLEITWPAQQEGTLLVVTTQGAQGVSAQDADLLGQQFQEGVEALDAKAITRQVASSRVPLQVLLNLARERGLESKTLNVTHSGNLQEVGELPQGSKEHALVMGYGVFALF